MIFYGSRTDVLAGAVHALLFFACLPLIFPK